MIGLIEVEIVNWICSGWIEYMFYSIDLDCMFVVGYIVVLLLYWEGFFKSLVDVVVVGWVVVIIDVFGCCDLICFE